jgi:hypothetical protein
MILGVAVVGFLIRELRRPQVAARVDRAMAVEAVRPAPVAPPRSPAPTADPAQFRELLSLAGWDAKRLSELQQEGALTETSRNDLAELLWRLKTFDSPQLSMWAREGLLADASASSDRAGELVALKGNVTKVTRRELPVELAVRLEMPAYYECEMTLRSDAGQATILTDRVPKAWLEMQSLDESAAASGVFIRLLPGDPQSPHGLFVSREIAWHPVAPNGSVVSLGKSTLGQLDVDVGLLDLVRQRREITSAEREAFYQVLTAASRIGTNQLDRFARQQLPFIAQHWAEEERTLTESAADPARLQLAREVQDRAAKGLYSVAPLFNDASNQVGELVSLEGTVRRVTPIDIDSSTGGSFRYYELDLFTDDSQNNPIVFCVRELPPGFPIGDNLHEPVRIAGFFFKSWSFRSRRANFAAADGEPPADAEMQQFAPLVIGRSPLVLEPADGTGRHFIGIVAAGMFLLLLGGIWAAGWWMARADRRFVRGTLAERYSLPEGESLNDLNLEVDRSADPAD